MSESITFIARSIPDVHALLPKALMFRQGLRLAPNGTLEDVLNATPGVTNRDDLGDGRCAIRIDADKTPAQEVLSAPQPIDISAGGFNWSSILTPGTSSIAESVADFMQPGKSGGSHKLSSDKNPDARPE